MTDNTQIIEKVYYNPGDFGSITATLKDAQNKSITYGDVNRWKYSQDFGQTAKKHGMNTFVADAPRDEYQMDLFFFPGAPQPKNALLMVDIFSKYTQVVPCRSKQTPDVLNAMRECIDKMGGKPKTIYSDNEGAVVSNEVRHVTTSAHAPVAERQITTIKDMIYKELDKVKRNGGKCYALYC